MSDFLTRLVDRQAGTVAMVRPRIPSMFTPPAGRTVPSDLPVIDSSVPQADPHHTSPASIHKSDRQGELLTQPDSREEQSSDFGPRPTPRAAPGQRQAASSPAPFVQNASAVRPQLAHQTVTSPHVSLVTIPNQAQSRQTEATERNVAGDIDSASLPPAVGVEPPSRLVATGHAMPRSAAAAPPSLASGAIMGRRTEPTHAVPPEAPVEVTIGRIEVTAVSSAPETKWKSTSRRPAMSLEEYLTRRQGGRP